MTPPTTIVLVVGGDGPSEALLPVAMPAEAVVVAADSGLHLAVALGLQVDHLVGDLDSAEPTLVAGIERAGMAVHRHPADKDATDSELALELVLELAAALSDQADVTPQAEGSDETAEVDGAVARGVAAVDGSRVVDGAATGRGAVTQPGRSDGTLVELLVLGVGGGRLDHLLADVMALGGPALAPLEVTARFGRATVTVVRPGRPRSIQGSLGEQVSLLPVHGRARGVTTEGLRWALVDADLGAGSTRAVSNELLGREARVAVAEGVVLVVRPGTVAPPIEPRSTTYDPTPVEPTAT